MKLESDIASSRNAFPRFSGRRIIQTLNVANTQTLWAQRRGLHLRIMSPSTTDTLLHSLGSIYKTKNILETSRRLRNSYLRSLDSIGPPCDNLSNTGQQSCPAKNVTFAYPDRQRLWS